MPYPNILCGFDLVTLVVTSTSSSNIPAFAWLRKHSEALTGLLTGIAMTVGNSFLGPNKTENSPHKKNNRPKWVQTAGLQCCHLIFFLFLPPFEKINFIV